MPLPSASWDWVQLQTVRVHGFVDALVQLDQVFPLAVGEDEAFAGFLIHEDFVAVVIQDDVLLHFFQVIRVIGVLGRGGKDRQQHQDKQQG